MDPKRLENIIIGVMVGTAALGTIYFLILEFSMQEDPSAIGWSLVAVVWFVVLRRVIYWRAGRKRDVD